MPRLLRALLPLLITAVTALPLLARPALPDVVARVDGEPITKADLERTVEVFILSTGKTLAEVPDGDYLSISRTVLKEMVNDRLLLRAAKDIEVSDRDVDARFDEIKRSYADEASFREEMIRSGQTEPFLKDQIRVMLKQERWLAEQVRDKLGVTPAEIELAYKRNQAVFTMPEQARLYHILIQVVPGDTPEQVKEKEKRMEAIAVEVKAGKNFWDLARQYSEDPVTKETGGSIGWIKQQDIDPVLGEAGFKLKEGEVSPVVRSKVGFHLLKCTGRAPAQPMPYDQVKERVATLLRGEKRRLELQKVLAGLQSKAKVEILLKG